MKTPATVFATSLMLTCVGVACAQNTEERPAREPLVGGPCEGCEAVFEGRPDTLTSSVRIAPNDEPGESLRIEGTVLAPDGQPVYGVIVYVYHTDASGIYPPVEAIRGTASYRHGRLRGWAVTDTHGRYAFDTIRPASYPNSNIPAHVHMHVIEPGCCTYYIDSIHFEDDPFLSSSQQDELATGRGGSGLVQPARDESRVWVIERDIHLGEGVPGYPESR